MSRFRAVYCLDCADTSGEIEAEELLDWKDQHREDGHERFFDHGITQETILATETVSEFRIGDIVNVDRELYPGFPTLLTIHEFRALGGQGIIATFCEATDGGAYVDHLARAGATV